MPHPETPPRWGEVYFVDFGSPRGSEQGGRRPAVIVSNDISNQRSPVVIVAALTSQQVEKRARYPMNVLVRDAGLPKESVVLGGQIFTIDKTRLERHLGELPLAEKSQLARALALTFGLRAP